MNIKPQEKPQNSPWIPQLRIAEIHRLHGKAFMRLPCSERGENRLKPFQISISPHDFLLRVLFGLNMVL